MKYPPVLLLDIMDTLVYNPFNQEIPDFFGLTQKELLREKDPTAWIEFELGEIDEPEYLRRYFDDARWFDHASFLRVVQNAYRWMDGAQQLLERLRAQGIEIHALSNYPVWYQTIESRLGLSRYLQWTFVSCHTGVRKPAPEAFLGAARALNRPPQKCLFVDDSLTNCQAAETTGMPAIHFVDATSLWTEMAGRGWVR
ncbi:MAG: HAD family phosphatase [Planctomycetota bacterium]|nr:HAD family phosphatase [Planctomycetota bacterium]